jgi:amidase
MARAGSWISERRISTVRAQEEAIAARVDEVFGDDIDIVITPATASGPPRVGARARSGAIVTVGRTMGRSPFQAIFNATGQPAAVVPCRADVDGIPTAVQLVARPEDEAILLSLCAQIEGVRPWAERRPPE